MKIKQNVPLSTAEKRHVNATRIDWPFAEMLPGSVVEVTDKKIWLKASKYAHTMAFKKKWKVTTLWDDEANVGRIRRHK